MVSVQIIFAQLFKKSFITVLLLLHGSSVIHSQQNQVCFTFDDFPYVQIDRYPVKLINSKITGFISTLKKYDAKPIAFINEVKLYRNGRTVDPKRVELLKLWIEAGFDMGNHGYKHVDLSFHSVEAFKEDVLQGEKIFAPMIQGKQKYYRLPELEVGNTLNEKKEVEKFLAENGYIIAPVTISAAEFMFAFAYSKAYFAKNEKYKKKISEDYLTYLSAFLSLIEEQSQMLFKRNIKQIMLFHMNELNIDNIENLINFFQEKKYKLISLSEALTDSVYSLPNTFSGKAGIGMLTQFALLRKMGGRPAFDFDRIKIPEYILELSKTDSYDFPYKNE
ncbi:MAG: hypothetical protein AMXMBFR48_16630 [Ignavibacteriales bacterium]